MGQIKFYRIWMLAALVAVFLAAGCACEGDECGYDGDDGVLKSNHPTVTFVAPYNTEDGVPIDRKMAATFSEAMEPTTVTIPGAFTVTGPGSVPVPGVVTYDTISHIALFTPDSDLAPSTTYIATISTGAQNPDGDALEFPFVWSFTTGVTADTVNPMVNLTTPSDLATGRPLNTAINAAFSEVMDPTTITLPGTFTIMQGATVVPGLVTYVGLIATFDPNVDLLPNKTYTALITTAATDLAGNPLVAGPVPNPWTFDTGAAPDTAKPWVTITSPVNLAIAVPIISVVTATFNEDMKPATIITANFKLTGPGLTPVLGTVGYNPATRVATFTPLSPLAINTTYTATVTTGAQDLASNALTSGPVPNPWTFITPAVLSPSPINLGAVANFAIIAGGGISSVPTSAITGDIGVSPASGSFITGFSVPLTCPEVTGTVYAVDAAGPACAMIDAAGLLAAKSSLTAAYNDAAGRTVPAPATVAGDQGGVTLPAGIYKSTSSLSIASGNLTLNAQGDPNAVWIFQIKSTLTTVGCGASVPCTTGGNVMLINGADAANVFWQVGSAATIGDYTDFYGTIMAYDDISINTGAHIHGRLLSGAQPSGAGAVTLISNTVILP